MTQQLHILHLEDSLKDAELIQAKLDAEGIACDVTRVDTREGFIAALERGGFDLILGDYSLPSFDGLSALKIAVEKSPDVPFIFVSRTPAEDVVIEAVNNGATDYVPKQNLQRLGACIRRAMREVQERAQRRHAESELQARYRELEILHTIGQDILGSKDLKALLERILRRIASFASFDLGVIRLLDPIRQVLIPSASYGYRDESAIRVHSVKSGDPTAGRIQIASVAGHGAFVEEDVNAGPGLRTLKAEGARSAVIVPVEAEGNVLGTILLGSRTPRKVPPATVRTLEAIGSQMGVAVQKARLYDEAQQNLARIRALHEIDKAIISTLDLGTVLNILLEKIELFLPIAAATTIRLLNPQTGELESLACHGLDEKEWKARQQRMIGGRARRVIETKAPVTVRNIQADPQTYNPAIFNSRGLVSYLGIPLSAKDEALGVLSLYTHQEHDFTQEEIEFLDTLGRQAALAIHNARLYQEATVREKNLLAAHEQLDALHTITAIASQSLELKTVTQSVVQKITEIFDFDATRIHLYDELRDELLLSAHFSKEPERFNPVESFPKGQGIAGRVAESGEPLIFEDLTMEPLYESLNRSRNFEGKGRRFFAALPIKSGREVLGTLVCIGFAPRRLSAQEIQLLTSMAGQIAVAVENASLYQEIMKRADELQRKTWQLEKADKVKMEFLGLMSHELRTPLNVIMGYTDLLFDGALGEINAAQGDGLRAVMTQSKDLLTMVENIMVATNAEAGTLVARWGKISLTEFLDELQQSHSVPAAKEIKLSWEYQTDFSVVETDADRLRQILHNLINNAIKYTEKGEVRITARLLPEKFSVLSSQFLVETPEDERTEGAEFGQEAETKNSKLTTQNSQVERRVELKVCDTGIGIDKKNLPVIFDIFHQADSSSTRAYEGAGLGLYIARKLTELLGGTIEVESEIDTGSTFTVKLPAQRTANSKR
ncbi:MAG: GAF domain-containing protein [Deltaproteobacteria bacterium]|nr:GAF domain-containing protein [Deltaproteobacteria bacterium]